MSLRNFYSTFESFESYDPESNIGKTRMAFWENFLKDKRNIIGGKALELACGGGLLSFVLSKMGVKVVGVDIQEEMIKRAENFAKKLEIKPKFILSDIRYLNLPDRFDTIFLVGNSIIHFNLKEFELVLDVVKRHLVDSGYFIIEYSDMIWEIYTGNIKAIPKNTAKGKNEISYDPEHGSINILFITKRVRDDLYEAEKHKLYIWAPWILKEFVARNGFKLAERFIALSNIFIDIYKLPKTSK